MCRRRLGTRRRMGVGRWSWASTRCTRRHRSSGRGRGRVWCWRVCGPCTWAARRWAGARWRSWGGRRGYRVGWGGDGGGESLGRGAEEVAVRGDGVEGGEVEGGGAVHAGGRRGVGVPREARGGGTALVAYLVCEGAPPPASELRS